MKGKRRWQRLVAGLVLSTLSWAHADLGDSGPLTVHIYSDEEHFVTAYTGDFAISIVDAREQWANGQAAFASPGGHIWIYLGNYEQAPENVRREALFHEYNHCERLALTRGEDAVGHRFWLAMAKHRDWKAAFADAFGTTPAEFYADFEVYRAAR